MQAWQRNGSAGVELRWVIQRLGCQSRMGLMGQMGLMGDPSH